MNKFLAILLTVAMMFGLASCKGEENSDTNISAENNEKINVEDVAEKVLEEAEEYESFSVDAVEYYLKKTVGIKLDDLEPEWSWKLKNNYCAYADDPSSGYGHAVIKFTKADGEVTDEEFDDWYAQVFDVTAKASQDGYNIRGYEFTGDGEDAFDKVTLEEALDGWLMKGWAFRCNDKIYVVYVSDDYDKEKDSELGKLFYYDSVEIDIAVGLQKSMSDTMEEAERYMEENEEEIEKAIKDYLG